MVAAIEFGLRLESIYLMRDVKKVNSYCLFIQILRALDSNLCKLLLLFLFLFKIFNCHLIKASLLLGFVNLSRYYFIKAKEDLFLFRILHFCIGLDWLEEFGSKKPMALIFKFYLIQCGNRSVEELSNWLIWKKHSLILILW